MKIQTIFAWFNAGLLPWLARIMGGGLALGMLLAVAGCGKEDKPASVTPATQPTNIAAAPVADPGPDLGQITRDLRRWILRNQRPPKNFEDFASSANVQIPPPPPGKKYAIDKQMHVILVNR